VRIRRGGYVGPLLLTHWVRLCVCGQVHRLTVPTTDRRVAEQLAPVRFAELKRQQKRRIEGLPDMVRMSTLLDEFEAQLAGRVAARSAATATG
jgi:hypothetical protein